MTINLAHVPVYKITCPACLKDTLYSIVDMISKNRLPCPICHESINVADHYRRTELQELMKKIGYSGEFIGVNDKFE